MLEFNLITSFSSVIYEAYCNAFPEDERRDKEQFELLFKNPKVKVLSIQQENKEKGYMIVWLLSEFLFLEHFEIFPECRGQKIGSSILSKLVASFPKIILESEPYFLNEISARRIDFYQRNGFSIVDRDYEQPAYSKVKTNLKLFLMANWTVTDVLKIKKEIYTEVYQYF